MLLNQVAVSGRGPYHRRIWRIKRYSCYCWNCSFFLKYLNSSLLAALQSEEEASRFTSVKGTEARSYGKPSCK